MHEEARTIRALPSRRVGGPARQQPSGLAASVTPEASMALACSKVMTGVPMAGVIDSGSGNH
eukprot:9739030-Heterocapsa_arctica.AAC.1